MYKAGNSSFTCSKEEVTRMLNIHYRITKTIRRFVFRKVRMRPVGLVIMLS